MRDVLVWLFIISYAIVLYILLTMGKRLYKASQEQMK